MKSVQNADSERAHNAFMSEKGVALASPQRTGPIEAPTQIEMNMTIKGRTINLAGGGGGAPAGGDAASSFNSTSVDGVAFAAESGGDAAVAAAPSSASRGATCTVRASTCATDAACDCITELQWRCGKERSSIFFGCAAGV